MIPISRRMLLEKYIYADAHTNSSNLRRCSLCISVSSITGSLLKGRSMEFAETQFSGTFNQWKNAPNKQYDLLSRRLSLSVDASRALPNSNRFYST